MRSSKLFQVMNVGVIDEANPADLTEPTNSRITSTVAKEQDNEPAFLDLDLNPDLL